MPFRNRVNRPNRLAAKPIGVALGQLSPRNLYVWRIIQSSAPIPYAIVEDGMNVPDSRVHNYPAPLERRAHKTKNDCAVQRARARARTSPA
jgi:hypothetical protein